MINKYYLPRNFLDSFDNFGFVSGFNLFNSRVTKLLNIKIVINKSLNLQNENKDVLRFRFDALMCGNFHKKLKLLRKSINPNIKDGVAIRINL